jgi:hypothetical protein
MLKQTLALIVVAALAGCQAGAEFNPQLGKSDSSDSERTQLAAFAASAEYPREAEASDNLRAAAVIDRKNNSIRIYNFSDRPLRDAHVWVNGAFVNKVDNIPPNGSIVIPRGDFYDATGRSLASQSTSASRVQIQWGNELYNLQGPVYE